MNLAQHIRNVPDFPIKGIQFKDITTLLKEPDALAASVKAFLERYENQGIDVVVGVESRGFIWGAILAYEMGIGVYGLMASSSGLIHSLVFFVIGMPLWAIGKKYDYSTQIQFFRARYDSDLLGYVLFPILVGLVIAYLLIGLLPVDPVLENETRKETSTCTLSNRVRSTDAIGNSRSIERDVSVFHWKPMTCNSSRLDVKKFIFKWAQVGSST